MVYKKKSLSCKSLLIKSMHKSNQDKIQQNEFMHI